MSEADSAAKAPERVRAIADDLRRLEAEARDADLTFLAYLIVMAHAHADMLLGKRDEPPSLA